MQMFLGKSPNFQNHKTDKYFFLNGLDGMMGREYLFIYLFRKNTYPDKYH
jgi:hypothetical protein